MGMKYLNGLSSVWISLPSFLRCSLETCPVFPCHFAPWLAVPTFFSWVSIMPAQLCNAGCCRWSWISFVNDDLRNDFISHSSWEFGHSLGKAAQTSQLPDPCSPTHPAWLQKAFLLFKLTGCLWTPLLHRLFFFSHTLQQGKRHLLFYT